MSIVLDPGAEFALKIESALKDLELKRDAADILLKSLHIEADATDLPPLQKSYLLPDQLEELFTLRDKRYQIFVISGIQETKDKRSIGFVAVTMPLASWEWYKFADEKFEGEKPDWFPKMSRENLDYFSDSIEIDFSNPLRFYYPVLAEYVDDPFNDEDAYRLRRQAVVASIKLLYEKFGFQVRYSESGDIPKEIPEEWLSRETREDYNDHMLHLDKELAKDPASFTLLYEKAGLLLSRERNQDALVFLKKAIEIEENIPQIWFLLSDVYSKLDQEENAKDAEAKARAVQKKLGMRDTKDEYYHLINPMNPSYYDAVDLGGYPPRERFKCEFCLYDFLYVKDDIWYACNACGAESAIPDASFDVNIKSEKQQFGSDWASQMILDVSITNKTNYDITFSTDDFELCLDEVEEESINEGDDKMITDTSPVCFAHMPEPHTTFILKPDEVKTTRISLGDMVWHNKDKMDTSKKYALFLLVIARVDAEWGKLKTHSESNTLFIHD